MSTSSSNPIRLMVVDDSAYNRRNIADVFAGHSEVEVVGKAADGEEALKLATLLKPDAITLDLEMPRMDGFTFLRILMSRQPTPVIVVSSYAQRENVFKALELGAIDFVTKPERQVAPDAVDVREEILAKVLMIRSIRPSLIPKQVRRSNPTLHPLEEKTLAGAASTSQVAHPYKAPKQVIVIASSTGGPSALIQLFSRFQLISTSAVLVAQHMPDKFTRTFAERLDKRGPMNTAEAQDNDLVSQLSGYVCPGRKCMELFSNGPELRLRVGPALPLDRYIPSADRLFTSAAATLGSRCVGIVLTGMGDDGLEGARAIRDAGGMIIAESHETAVVFGMPGAIVRSGIASKVLPLPMIGDFIAGL